MQTADFDFILAIVTGPACVGRSPTEALEYATAMLAKDKTFGLMEWDERKIWREIVKGPACAGRSIDEANEYAQPFVDIERERQEPKRQAWRMERQKQERRNDRIKTALTSAPSLFIAVAVAWFFLDYLIARKTDIAAFTALVVAAQAVFLNKTERGRRFMAWTTKPRRLRLPWRH